MTGALSHVLAVVGSMLYMSASIPALVVVLRNREADAVSPMTLDLLLLSGIWWVVYSYDIGNVPSLISSSVAVLSPIAILFLKLTSKAFPLSALAILVGACVAMVVIDDVSVRDLGLCAAGFSFLIIVPTVWRILIRKEPAPNASVMFWVIQAVTAVVWLVYAIMIGHIILGATGILVAPAASLISVTLHRQSRTLVNA